MSRYPDERRPVITSMGATTCLGKSPNEFWNNIKSCEKEL